MKPIVLIYASVLIALGCASPAPPAISSPSSNPEIKPPNSDLRAGPSEATLESGELITHFGEYRIQNTIVEANESEGKFSVKFIATREHPGGRSTNTTGMSTPPGDWPLSEGWFAYVQQDGTYVWLYNGGAGLLLVEHIQKGGRTYTNTYGVEHFPIPIPGSVLKHLREPLRSKLIGN